ncbi:polysaccharide deacetylase family protein [Sporosarcina cascadiensis]|uniref:hypothetical protein n=1 Tax=Sporosarcina cascadiensis TaxID=2660747 RepID=UPI00129B9CD3|nr:hypothetical protein [Sporosarcina cascadiensis]
MLKKIILISMLSLLFILYLPKITAQPSSLTAVFRLAEHPAVIVKGVQGSAATIDISFGEQEIEELVDQLSQPYPLLFIDSDWALRFPHIVEKIKKRSIPVALLGQEGSKYEENTSLFIQQLEQFEEAFKAQPLWFRTTDEVFPQSLLQAVNEAEINALGSTVHWSGGDLPKKTEGEIIAVPHHREERVRLKDIERLLASRPFQSVEDLLFQPSVKTKKLPK